MPNSVPPSPGLTLGNDLATLDHLVHKVGSGELERAIAAFAKLGFTVHRGGKHSDGLTSNAQICFADGTYLELLAFEQRPPSGERGAAFTARRAQHPWWNKRPGWVDWCLAGGAKDGRVAKVNQLAVESGSSVRYSGPKALGRRTAEGRDVQFQIAFPLDLAKRSSVPFWCEDVSPREWRVPAPEPPHRNRSTGICGLTLLFAPGESLNTALNSLSLVLDTTPTHRFTQTHPSVPLTTLEFMVLSPSGGRIPVHVRVADDPSEVAWVKESGPGLFEVNVRVAADQLPATAPPDGLERSLQDQKWGRIRMHPVFDSQQREFWE